MNKVITPEFIQGLIGLIVILLTSFFPEFREEIVTIAGATVAILIAVFVRQNSKDKIEIEAFKAAQVNKKDC